jgi:hypothetical protein
MYELFDILEKHGFIMPKDVDKIADLPDARLEKLFLSTFLSYPVAGRSTV